MYCSPPPVRRTALVRVNYVGYEQEYPIGEEQSRSSIKLLQAMTGIVHLTAPPARRTVLQPMIVHQAMGVPALSRRTNCFRR